MYMGNILSYLDVYGNVTMDKQEFNSIDNVILCEFAYIDFVGIAATDNSQITIQEAYKKMMRSGQGVVPTRGSRFISTYTPLMEKLAASKRFQNAKLSNLVDIYDDVKHMQFAAMSIHLDDDSIYIVFRGTDQTIIGWRENFTMTYQVMPAQLEAAAYIDNTIRPNGKYRIGGHSKGGNLALYAAMMCRDDLKEHVIKVYNNDGPGINKEMFDEKRFNLIKDKILFTVPQSCIIGMIYDNGVDKQVIKSSKYGIMQHDTLSWMVEGNSFVPAERLHSDSSSFNAIVIEWLEDMDIIEREALTSHFFGALAVSGAKSLYDIPKGGIGSVGYILRTLIKSKKEAKAATRKLARTVGRNIQKRVRFGSRRKENNE